MFTGSTSQDSCESCDYPICNAEGMFNCPIGWVGIMQENDERITGGQSVDEACEQCESGS